MVTEVDIPKNSVIVARHGVEYLSAWHFKTDVVLDSYYPSADLSQYSSVFTSKSGTLGVLEKANLIRINRLFRVQRISQKSLG